jgi:hypothetical protein
MRKKAPTKETAPKSRKTRVPKDCQKCSKWKDASQQMRIANLLAKAISGMESRLQSEDYKPSIADYLKLLQFEQEFERETPKEIKVTWVEGTEGSKSET